MLTEQKISGDDHRIYMLRIYRARHREKAATELAGNTRGNISGHRVLAAPDYGL